MSLVLISAFQMKEQFNPLSLTPEYDQSVYFKNKSKL